MFDEEDLLPISALQHLAFCERQWALIHLEGIWEENRLTVEGRHLHSRVDSPDVEVRADVRIVRGLRLRSLRLGLAGRADVVEFHLLPGEQNRGMRLGGLRGLWEPVPVEYKRGRPKPGHADEVQICAQALCMEEMTGNPVPEGVLFYGRPMRRYEVLFDSELRLETELLSSRLHELTRSGRTPPPEYGRKCRNCSLLNLCMPRIAGRNKKVDRYLADAFLDAEEES